MPYRAHEPPQDIGLLGVVGWIFADMLLMLVVLFLAAQTGGAVAQDPTSSTAPTSTPTTPPPTTTTTTLPPGVDSNFACFRVLTDPVLLTAPPSPQRDAHLTQIEQQVANQLAQPNLAGRTAGVVLTFGVAEQPGEGEHRAEIFNSEILPRFAFFSRDDRSPVTSRAFWGGRATDSRAAGTMIVNVYPIIDQSHGLMPQSTREDC